MTILYREFRLTGKGVWETFKAFVSANAKACINAGKPLRIIVTSEERKRNVEQNKRLWGYLYETIAEQAWVNGRRFDKDVWHEHYARLFGACDEMVLPDGEIIIVRKSTTAMTVGEFAEFMQKIEAHAASELGVEFDQ